MPSASSGTLALRQGNELSPALRSLMELFIPPGSRCLNLRLEGGGAIGAWLLQQGCSYVEEDASQACLLRLPDESFDAALLIGALDQPLKPQLVMAELRRVLRPGGVLIAVTPNSCYWRRRLDRVLSRDGAQIGSCSPSSLRCLLVKGGFSLVGIEGQGGGFVRDLPLAGRLCRKESSVTYRVAERLLPSLLGAQLGAFAIRV